MIEGDDMKKYKFILILLGIMLLAVFNFNFGNDYFWHVKTGEYIINNLSVPTYDIFSWIGLNNFAWISHEWLSEVVIYGFKAIFGDFGPLFFCLIMYGILVCLLLFLNKDNLIKNKLFSLLWIVFGFLVFSAVMLPRPHLISYILFIICVYILYDLYDNEDSKKIYFLPLISVLWVNFHGGSSNLTYILCLIFLICGLCNFKFGRLEARKISKKQIKKFILGFVLSFLGIMINPHGIKLITYPYENMQDKVMISNITEWFSPSLNNIGDLWAFVLIGVIVLVLIISKKRIKFINLVLLGAFLFLALKSYRFMPFLYIVSSFIIFDFIDKGNFEFSKFLNVIMALFILILSIVLSFKLVNSYNQKMISDDIINYIKKVKPKRLFNFYGYGGYLIYNNIPVFIDGRADMYSKHTLKDTFDLQNNGYNYILDKYNFDMIIIPKNIALNIYLLDSDEYVLSKQDDEVLVYEKKL